MKRTGTRDQMRAAYLALGLAPDRFDHTAMVTLHSEGVTVERFIPGPDGRPTWTNAEGRTAWQPSTETVELMLVDE